MQYAIWNVGSTYRLYSDLVIADILAALLTSQSLHNQVWVNVWNNQVGYGAEKEEPELYSHVARYQSLLGFTKADCGLVT